jgi:hypothetical protein
MNYHTIKNQEIIGELVNREVYLNIGGLISEIPNFYEEHMEEIFRERYTDDQYLIQTDHPETGECTVYRIDEDGETEGIDTFNTPTDEDGDFLEDPQDILDTLIEADKLDVWSGATAFDDIDDAERESEPAEVLEWWAVSNMAARDLRERGQVIIEDYGLNIWGRQTSGQAILLDAVWGLIAEDLQILEGQECEW